VARHAVETQIAALVIKDGHRDVDPILEVAFDRLDDRHLVLQHDVHDIGPASRAQANSVAGGLARVAERRRS
jgi:hypothetical protein